MARRSDHSREELHEMALTAAREIAEEDGLDGLTARRIAARIGYSPGTLYNIFDDLDDLIVHLNGRTLDALHEALAAEPPESDPESAMLALARGYLAFTRDHARLWNMLFEHHLSEERTLPDWHHEKIGRLLALIEHGLAPLFAPGQQEQRIHAARVLWSSMHGMCSLDSGKKLLPGESIEAMVTSLVVNYLAGLRASAAGRGG